MGRKFGQSPEDGGSAGHGGEEKVEERSPQPHNPGTGSLCREQLNGSIDVIGTMGEPSWHLRSRCHCAGTSIVQGRT